MSLYGLILGCTSVAVVGIGVADYRINKRFDKVDQDHAKLHAEIDQQHQLQKENVESHNRIVAVLISMRDNSWSQFKTIHMHLMELFRWDK